MRKMNDELNIVQNLIHEIRGMKVMLDFDLARLYQVETKVLKQAVRRNIERFPADFMFVLTKEEHNSLIINPRSQFVTSEYEVRNKQTKYLLQLQQEENKGTVNELSENVRHNIETLYRAISELASRLTEKQNTPRPRIGFK